MTLRGELPQAVNPLFVIPAGLPDVIPAGLPDVIPADLPDVIPAKAGI